MDLPDPEEVLEDPVRSKCPTGATVPTPAALSWAIAAAVAANPTERRWLAAWKVLGRAADKGADVAASRQGCSPVPARRRGGTEGAEALRSAAARG